MKAKQIKKGFVYFKNGYTVYYSGGLFRYSAFNVPNWSAETLTELKRLVLINEDIKL